MGISVATVQMQADPFAVADNLTKAEYLVRSAASQGARLVLLPELFHVGYTFSRRLREYTEYLGSDTTQWMLALSRSLGVHLGGCIAECSVSGNYDTFVLVSPTGKVHTYRKRYPGVLREPVFPPWTPDGYPGNPARPNRGNGLLGHGPWAAPA